MTGLDASIHIRNARASMSWAPVFGCKPMFGVTLEEEIVPRRAFVVASKIGGQVIAAFDTSAAGADSQGEARTLIGFAMALPGFSHALPGVAEGEPYLHSHMLAVRPEYRKQGIGRRLKLFQREEALSRGIHRMEWTFDPLEIKNASLNIARLGAIARRYEPNLYGVSSSRLQGALPTDRLYAEWWMDSDRVDPIVGGKPAVPHADSSRPFWFRTRLASGGSRQRSSDWLLRFRQENRRAI